MISFELFTCLLKFPFSLQCSRHIFSKVQAFFIRDNDFSVFNTFQNDNPVMVIFTSLWSSHKQTMKFRNIEIFTMYLYLKLENKFIS